MVNNKSYMLGIAGGTGSGKTTLADKILNTLTDKLVTVIDCDAYYKDLSHIPLELRHTINFDHPDSIDITLLKDHLQKLKKGEPINKHTYDYKKHCRGTATVKVEPKRVVIVEGVLIFAIKEIADIFDYKVFIDEEPDLRLLRRMVRDVKKRGRNIDTIADQYLNHVKPMYDKFVAPSKKEADIVLKNNGTDAGKVFQVIEKALEHER